MHKVTTANREVPPFSIDGAKKDDAVTDLLDQLRDEEYSAANTHEGMRTIRHLIEGNEELDAPLVDLVAVLPDLNSNRPRGLHISSYASLENEHWYPDLLKIFFSTGGRGSLLALKDFDRCVGQYRIRRAKKKTLSAKPRHNMDFTTMSDFFPTPPEKLEYDVDKRFSEYADLLLEQFDNTAVAVWICFGPRAEASVKWGGSLFLVVQPRHGTRWRDETLKGAVERVFGVLNGSFHRAIVNSAYEQDARHQLELTYFAFGHELKNRIDGLRMGELRNKIHAKARQLLPDIDRCRERLGGLRGMAGVFSIVAKTQDGALPSTWIATSDVPGPLFVPTEKDQSALHSALVEAVTKFAYLEDTKGQLTLRYVSEGGVVDVARPTSFQTTLLPPFSSASQEPHLCFLSGLAELCRNAARAVLIPGPEDNERHVDFTVKVSKDDSFTATVSLLNPLFGTRNVSSQSIDLLKDLFKRLGNIVELHQAQEERAYRHAVSNNPYLRSSFVFFPKRIKVVPSSHSH